MTVPAIRRLIRPHLDEILDGDLRAVVADTGGAGLCWEASEELIQRTGQGKLLYLDFTGEWGGVLTPRRRWGHTTRLPAWTARYLSRGRYADGGHAVALFGDVVVDLTARQFRRSLPFPWVFRDPALSAA